MPIISKLAGKKHIRIAGRPILIRVLKSRARPDLVKIIIKAICLK